MTLEIQKLRLVTLLNYYCKCIITFPKPGFTIVPYFLVCILIINLSLLGAPVSFIVVINRMCKISIKWNRLICIKMEKLKQSLQSPEKVLHCFSYQPMFVYMLLSVCFILFAPFLYKPSIHQTTSCSQI